MCNCCVSLFILSNVYLWKKNWTSFNLMIFTDQWHFACERLAVLLFKLLACLRFLKHYYYDAAGLMVLSVTELCQTYGPLQYSVNTTVNQTITWFTSHSHISTSPPWLSNIRMSPSKPSIFFQIYFSHQSNLTYFQDTEQETGLLRGTFKLFG